MFGGSFRPTDSLTNPTHIENHPIYRAEQNDFQEQLSRPKRSPLLIEKQREPYEKNPTGNSRFRKLTPGKGVLPALSRQFLRQVQPLLGVDLRRGQAAMAEDCLGSLQPELVANHLGLRVSQLVRRPVDEPCCTEFRDPVGLVNPRRRLLSDPVGYGLMVGIRRVMIPDVFQVRLRLAVLPRLAGEVTLSHRFLRRETVLLGWPFQVRLQDGLRRWPEEDDQVVPAVLGFVMRRRPAPKLLGRINLSGPAVRFPSGLKPAKSLRPIPYGKVGSKRCTKRAPNSGLIFEKVHQRCTKPENKKWPNPRLSREFGLFCSEASGGFEPP